jgi:hypothetical protein
MLRAFPNYPQAILLDGPIATGALVAVLEKFKPALEPVRLAIQERGQRATAINAIEIAGALGAGLLDASQKLYLGCRRYLSRLIITFEDWLNVLSLIESAGAFAGGI